MSSNFGHIPPATPELSALARLQKLMFNVVNTLAPSFLIGSFSFLQVTRIDVYETLCLQQMLVHKGGKIKNWGGECRDVTSTKLQSQNTFKESTGGRGSG